MEILNISGVLYALGWAILHSIWQMGILWILYQLIFGIPKKWSPAVKHNSSLFFLFAGFAWFLATGMKHFQEYIMVKQYADILPEADSPAANFISITQAGTLSDTFLAYFSRLSQTSLQFLEYNIVNISALYLFILVLMMFRFTNAYIYANQLKKKGLIPAGHYLEGKILDWKKLMGIPQQVSIFLSEQLDIPATIGFFKPVILLPVATLNQLNMEQVESIILHELAHIRRMDYVWNMAAAVIETILFFNPFVYLLTSVQKKERELCCDDFVLGFNLDPHNYATALLTLEKTRIAGKAQLAMASNGEEGQLLNRIKRILNLQTNRLQHRQRFMALLFISTLLSALAWLQPVQWKKENSNTQVLSSPSMQWMLKNETSSVPTLSNLIKKQVIFNTPERVNAKKTMVEKTKKPEKNEIDIHDESENILQNEEASPYAINENRTFVFDMPPNPLLLNAPYMPQDLQKELQKVWEMNSFEQIRPEVLTEIEHIRKGRPLFFNQAPPPGWEEQRDNLISLKNKNDALALQENYAFQFKDFEKTRELKKVKEQVFREQSKARIIKTRKEPNRIFINGEPVEDKVILDGEKPYSIRIETGDETIEISVGLDTLHRRIIKTPGVSDLSVPLRSTITKRSADTYPRNHY